MEKASDGYRGLGIPKPNYKKLKAKWKRQLRKKDVEFQASIPDNALCVAAGKSQCVGSLIRHHLLRRRNMKERFNEENSLILCTKHHLWIHSLSAKRFEELTGINPKNLTNKDNNL
jgi:hypothetical protein